MFKAIVNGNGERTMILGLSHENLARLKDGQPILFDMSQLGYRLVPARAGEQGHRVLIAAAETERAVAVALGLPDLGDVMPGEQRFLRLDP